MGMDFQVRLGPYLEVSTTLTEPVTTVKRKCPNHPEVTQFNNKFCPICGETIINVDDIKVEKIRACDIIEWDKLIPPGGFDNILLPQKSPPNDFDFDIDDKNSLNLLGKDVIINEQVEWFNKTYANEIKILRDKFGENNVHLKWGIISYWS
jgi:hypothetical protein